MSYTFTDKFCGAGGSSAGLRAAGLKLRIALNHWDKAIETHAANFDAPGVEHRCVDINKMDKRTLPATHVLWGSPICTEESPGGGKKKRKKPPTIGQLMIEEDAHVPQEGHERTRATFWDIIGATEVHRYPIVIVENVVEVMAWELIDVWIAGMKALGYHCQIVCVSAAHIGDQAGNDPAPQWRDRIYFFFTRLDLTPPVISPQPLAWCFGCEREVNAVQWWKPHVKNKVGKYRAQYLYRCPRVECRHSVVEPFVLPAAAAIDWTDTGTRIGDRAKPLAAATMRRIRAGADLIARPYMMAVNHDGGRYYPAEERPLPSRTGKIGDALVVPCGGSWNTTPTLTGDPLRTRMTRDTEGLAIPGSYITTLRNNVKAQATDSEPLRTVTAGGNHHYLSVPGAFIQKHHGGVDYKGVGHMVKDVNEPLAALVGRPNMSLVIPYRSGSKPALADAEPWSTLATVEQHGTAMAPATDADIADYHFRMIKWRESARAQRFYDDYQFTGNSSENTMMAGNAVASNVAQWLGGYAIATLDGAA